MTGIGGQGIQLAAQLLAHTALAEGREVQLFGSYGGMMRGGETEATLIVGDGPIESPPTINRTWSAIVMHHEHSEPTLRRLRPGSVVLVNTTVVGDQLDDRINDHLDLGPSAGATSAPGATETAPRLAADATDVRSPADATEPSVATETAPIAGMTAATETVGAIRASSGSGGAGTVVEVPATELAGEVGSLMAASMVMLGAYAAMTGLVDLATLVATLPEILPAYRRQHVALNEAALRAGHDAVIPGLAPAWEPAPGVTTSTAGAVR